MVESLNECNDEVLTVADAAIVCKVSTWAMYKRVKNNTAPAHHMGKRIYFLKSELFGYMKEI